MRRRRWFVGSMIAAVLVLSVTGGAVLAQEVGPDGDAPLKSFAARVAEILGLQETEVQDALDQASTEIRDERLEQKLNGLVGSGRLTQEQADEYREWVQSRPEGLSPRFGHGGRGGFGGRFGGGRGFHGRGHFGVPSEAPAPEGTSL